MNFLWPEMLWLAGLLPLLIALYVWLLRRRKKPTLRFANLALVKQAIGKSIGWRRLLDAELCALNFSFGSSMTAEATFPAGGSGALGSPSKCGRLQCDRQCEFLGRASPRIESQLPGATTYSHCR